MGCAFVARSEKQSIATDSTAAAEIIALHSAANRVESLAAVLAEIHGPRSAPIPIHCDNFSAISCATTNTERKSKALNSRLAKLRDLIAGGIIEIRQVPSKRNYADFFTKILPPDEFTRMRSVVMGFDLPRWETLPTPKK